MGLLSRLVTSLRGDPANQRGAGALDLFEDEIDDWEQQIQQAKQTLSAMISERIGLEQDFAALNTAFADKQARAIEALEGEPSAQSVSMARQLAGTLAQHEPLIDLHQRRLRQLQEHELQFKENLLAALQQAQEYRRELREARQHFGPRPTPAGSADAGDATFDLHETLANIRRERRLAARCVAQLNATPTATATATADKPGVDEAAPQPRQVEQVFAELRQRATSAPGQPQSRRRPHPSRHH